MNRIVSLILMLCLSCQLVLKLSIVAWFKINQDYIAATLCENRNKPELVCCGKCVLTKELKKANDAENKGHKNSSGKVEHSAQLLFVLPTQTVDIVYSSIELSIQHAVLPNLYARQYLQRIFHPPSSFFS